MAENFQLKVEVVPRAPPMDRFIFWATPSIWVVMKGFWPPRSLWKSESWIYPCLKKSMRR